MTQGTPGMKAAERWRRRARRHHWVSGGLAVVLLGAVLLGLGLGPVSLSWGQVLAALVGTGADPVASAVVWELRLPRLLAALLAGWGLALSGASLQVMLRNPLASPFTLGVAQGAAFGAAAAITLVGQGVWVGVAAFAGALAVSGAVLLLARARAMTPEALILAGVALAAVANAGTMLIQYFADELAVASIVFWTFGDAGRASWGDVWLMLAAVVPFTAWLVFYRWTLDALGAGDQVAASLGVKVERLRALGVGLAALVAALVVARLGVIGFVGLVAPHAVRRLTGDAHATLIPQAALVGALLLVLADTAARTALSPVLLPVGILTALIGAPVFLALLGGRGR
ncbi:MAG: iron ABC transporter permease [Deltaproteobacteria bacterium]|nr:iron ABC transporter permease [Deltaproteobacteria bacterium]